MSHIRLFLFCSLLFICNCIRAQVKKIPSDDDKKALEGIVVEKYYVATSADLKDTLGGVLAKGAVTYRIYADLKPGCSLQAVYGDPHHLLQIATTTEFFNNTNSGAKTGDQIKKENINDGTTALDSWVTIGFAIHALYGVPLSEDKDGSIIKKVSLNKADGFMAGTINYKVVYVGTDLHFFDDPKASSFTTDNASWAVFGGVKGVTESNKVLIAQLTTNGKLTFKLNVMVGTPNGMIHYVAKDPEGSEIQFDALSFSDEHQTGNRK